MLTSILLLLTLPSADVAPGTCVSDSRARQTALSPPTSGGEARLDLIRAEAVDEESEEEEFGGQGPPGDFPSSGTNASPLDTIAASIGSPHLRLERDRRGSPRSPPGSMTILPNDRERGSLG